MRDNSEKTERSKKGVIQQLFGVVLLGLGLNTMLAFKGAIEPDWFNYLLMALGTVFLAAGLWRYGRS